MKSLIKALWLAACAAAFLAVVFPDRPVRAQAWPARPVTVVVPFAAGGTTDALGRLVAQQLSVRLGQPVVVENRAGAGGGVGASAVAKAAPDGYTLLMGAVSTHAINPSLYKTLTYDPVKDFAPIAYIAGVPNLLVVSPKRVQA
ncbi:MAG: Bug family tripartite tricarboxylate transporter substrate binding protein, partial [Ferrovibrio sp.]